MEIEVIVEIPQGSRNKYEADHDTGVIWLDRHLFTAARYPLDYGYFPQTLSEDGDPLDALILLEESTFPGCHVHARPIAVFWMRDDAGPDAKILCVPSGDPRWEAVQDLDDLRPGLVAEIAQFFEIYKVLEPNKESEIRGWEGRAAAEAEIEASRQRHRENHQPDR